LESYTLNRLLVWLACELGFVTYKPGLSLKRVEPVPLGTSGAWCGYVAHLRHCKLTGRAYQDEDRWESDVFDEVIVRYGAIRPDWS